MPWSVIPAVAVRVMLPPAVKLDTCWVVEPSALTDVLPLIKSPILASAEALADAWLVLPTLAEACALALPSTYMPAVPCVRLLVLLVVSCAARLTIFLASTARSPPAWTCAPTNLAVSVALMVTLRPPVMVEAVLVRLDDSLVKTAPRTPITAVTLALADTPALASAAAEALEPFSALPVPKPALAFAPPVALALASRKKPIEAVTVLLLLEASLRPASTSTFLACTATSPPAATLAPRMVSVPSV